MKWRSSRLRLAAFSIFAGLARANVCAQGQAKLEAAPPPLSDHFTLTLSPAHDIVFKELVETLEERDVIRRRRELEESNAGIFSRTLDLLRYVPIRLSGSDGGDDDFFMPNYLRSGYGQAPTHSMLFEPR